MEGLGLTFEKEAREVLDSLYSYTEGYPADSLSKEAVAWLYRVAYSEFRAKANEDATRQIREETQR
jgi:hypothetical protein